MFSAAHRANLSNTTAYDRGLDDLTVEQHNSQSLTPVAAALPPSAHDDSDDSDSDSSYSKTEPVRDPNGKILIATRLASDYHAARCYNYRNEKRTLADPTFTYTPREIIVAPAPRKRNRKRTRKNTTT